MPEGHWSLSTLPGNGLLVRMGLEGSLWFLPGPLLNQSWFGPEPQQWSIPGTTEVESISSWSTLLYFSLSMCVCEISKHQNFISHCLLWRFLRQCHQCKVESFNLTSLEYRTKPIDGRSLSFTTELSTHTTVFHFFSLPQELHSKASQRVRLFAVCLCLDSARASAPFSRSLSKSVTQL